MNPKLRTSNLNPMSSIHLGSFIESQCRWPTIIKECFSVFMSIKNVPSILQNANLLVHLDHKLLLKIFMGCTNNEKCNTWGLEATAIPRHIKAQHIKGITNVLANSVSRLRAMALYHDFDSKTQRPLTRIQCTIQTPTPC